MKPFITIVILLISLITQAQTTIFGTVTDVNKQPILGANVYLKGTYDGASTLADGSFSFRTSNTGQQSLVISFVSFETFIIRKH